MSKDNVLEKVLKNNLCTGCGICSSICHPHIKMGFNEKGFLRPVWDKVIEDKSHIINDVCPGIIVTHDLNKRLDPFLGPFIKIRKGFSTHEEIHFKSASGGTITGIAWYLLKSKKVDYVIHIGPNENNPILNQTKLSTDLKNLIENCGSRYSPSAPLVNILEIIKKPGQYLFIGKPCDISALKRYSRYNPEIKKKIPYMFSFFCAGVPSINGTRQILDHFQVDEYDVLNLRYRGYGWPGKFYVNTKSGNTYEMSYQNSWGNVLGKQIQSRCKICADGTGEFADLSFGDAWIGETNGYPDFSEKDGQSFIVSRTGRGESIIQECIKNNIISLSIENCSSVDVARAQPFQFARKSSIIARLTALKILKKKYPEYTWEPLKKLANKQGLLKNTKQFLGMLKRTINKRKT